MNLSITLNLHCTVPGCRIVGHVTCPVEARTVNLMTFYGRAVGPPLELPPGWSEDGSLCPDHARPLRPGQDRPPPTVLAKAAQLRQLALHPLTPSHEAENAWAALRKLAEQYDLLLLEED